MTPEEQYFKKDELEQHCIKFAEFIDNNYYRIYNNNWSDYETMQGEYTTKQLYDRYINKQS